MKMYSATKTKIERLGQPLVDKLPKDLSGGHREREIDKILEKICKELGYESSNYHVFGKKCYLYN